jgi:hypothetical protein
VTDDGIQIEVNEEQSKNARSPITESRLTLSNVTFRTWTQNPKHPSEIVSTVAGIDIDANRWQRKNAPAPKNEI